MIGGSVDILREELLLSIAIFSSIVGSLHPLHEAIGLELLHHIVPDQVDQVNTYHDEDNEYVVETGVHNFCRSIFIFFPVATETIILFHEQISP